MSKFDFFGNDNYWKLGVFRRFGKKIVLPLRKIISSDENEHFIHILHEDLAMIIKNVYKSYY